MAYLIGTDEAGYAPNLGPLVISATVWQVPDDPLAHDLYKLLRKLVCRSAPAASAPNRRLAIADSKVLYRAGEGLWLLERGLLAALELADQRPTCWRHLWDLLDCDAAQELDSLPWHVGYGLDLPLEVEPADLDKLAVRLRAGFAACGVRLLKVRSAAVFPERFNERTEQYDNKGEALSRFTLHLLTTVMAGLDDGPVLIFCDKHGGRNHYGPLLQQHFPDWLVEVHKESRAESIYRWGPSERRREARFCMHGERHLPVALASMASKYLREIAMRAFNHFWCRHVPELRPTAGYPGDSRRFKDAIREKQACLAISDRVLWRNR